MGETYLMVNISNEYIFECSNLSKKYGHIIALDNATFKLKKGRIIGLLGPNGAGKTTIIKLINGLIYPSSGSLYIDKFKVGVNTKKIVSYYADTITLPKHMTVNDTIKYYNDMFCDFDRERAIKMIEELSVRSDEQVKNLSKGNQEKIQLILTMSRDAKLYVLDEPLGGIDPATRDYILDTIIKNHIEESTILISTHLIQDVEKVLDDVLFIKDGKIIYDGTKDDIIKKENKTVDEYFREMYKC